MATTINKQRLLSQVFAAGKKGGGPAPESRPVLEEFIYGLCRENATPQQAEQAYRSLCERFFDWNEVRVSSQRELEEALADLTGVEMRAERLIGFLQEVFETKFAYDLEDLQKKGLKVAAKQLGRYQAANEYTSSWVTQRSLGGHAIPVDAPTLRCTRRLGLVECGPEECAAARATLEHLVPKAKGALFTDAISTLAEEYCSEEAPNCPACPLAGECATAQEVTPLSVPAPRLHRPKPR